MAELGPAARRVVEGLPVTVTFHRHPTARRYHLTLKRDGTFRCTIPRRGNRAEAEEFVWRNASWMAASLHRRASRPQPPTHWRLGTPVHVRGELVEIRHAADGPFLEVGPLRIPQPSAEETNLRPRIEQYLRQLATLELPALTRALAERHHLPLRSVQIRNQKTRWGSCSARKVISLNWRLIQLPPAMAEYVILHELAHLTFLNHSPDFWKEVGRLCPGYLAAEAWLDANTERFL